LDEEHFVEKNGQLKLPEIYHNFYTDPKGTLIDFRSTYYQQQAETILGGFFEPEASEPEHLILVTNTGYESPNPIQKLISIKSWHSSSANCFANDCYAAFPAIELAIGALYNPFNSYETVDIVHIELNSIHVDISEDEPENLIVMSLFGDGAIHYQASKIVGEHGLKVYTILQQLIPNSTDQMSWKLGSHHFKMTLKPYVPLFIDEHIEAFVERLLKQQNLTFKKAKEKAIWAIHPGGPKIVDFVQKKLNLSDEQVAHSRQVLNNYGNMSSATLPHIWRDLIVDESIKKQTPIVSLAFGPGLTVYGLVGEKV